ncbi:hypothetical protein BH23CHL1_BH23CHL1_09730 [soil metagenome]
MNQSEIDRMERLNRYLDELSLGLDPERGTVDLEFDPSFQRLQQLDRTPGPTSAFATRLQQQLAVEANASVRVSRRRIPRQWIRRVDLASAATLAAAMLVIVIFYGISDPEGEPVNRVTLTNDPTPTTVVRPRFNATPTDQAVAVSSPEPSPTDEAVAVVPPEPSPTSPAQETPAPQATPPVQLSDIPFYDSLEQMLNTADVVVVGQPTGNITEIDANEIYSEFRVNQTLRGRVEGETILLLQLSELEPDQTYLLLLSRAGWGVHDAYTSNMTVSPVGVEDGLIMPPGYTSSEYSIAKEYANQPLEALAEDIAAIPEIQPVIRDLVSQYGWEPIGKGYLRPVDVPDRDAFSDSTPLRYSDETWEMALAASQRVGLDFSQFAGQQLQILPYNLERPQTDGERGIQAMLLISEQQIVGAWVDIAFEVQPFGLDQRDEALEIPVAVPTPEPTPTWLVPSGDTVNPVDLYNLEDAAYLNFYWTYCDEIPQPAEIVEAVTQALDQEFSRDELAVYPTPTHSQPTGEASGEAIVLVFSFGEPFNGNEMSIRYDRQAGRILLPYDGGWITAPPELAAALEDIEVPPPPSKTKP